MSELFTKISNEFFTGYMPTKDVETFVWKQEKIPLALWHQIVGFMTHSYEKRKAEAQLRLYYNSTLKEWTAYPLPQYPSGMTTKEEPDHELAPKLREQAGIDHPDWLNIGTVHHHCRTKAFQSGVDHSDEIDQDGIHITIGCVDKVDIDIHSRFVFDKSCLEVELEPFIDFSSLPEYLLKNNSILQAVLRQNAFFTFPEFWKEALIERPVVKNYSKGYNNGYYGGYGGYGNVNREPLGNIKEAADDLDDEGWGWGLNDKDGVDVLAERCLEGIWSRLALKENCDPEEIEEVHIKRLLQNGDLMVLEEIEDMAAFSTISVRALTEAIEEYLDECIHADTSTTTRT